MGCHRSQASRKFNGSLQLFLREVLQPASSELESGTHRSSGFLSRQRKSFAVQVASVGCVEERPFEGFVIRQVRSRGRRRAWAPCGWAETGGDREIPSFRGHVFLQCGFQVKATRRP